MNLAFLIDPPESLKIAKDTSFALMLEAQARGHNIYVLERGDISLSEGKLLSRARRAHVKDSEAKPFDLESEETLRLEIFDALWIRTDPPFDTNYINDTWLLSQADSKPLVINRPSGLREINEKIWAAQFTQITPPTLITSSLSEFQAFLKKYNRAVIKPTDGFGGSSVFLISEGDKNAAVAFETLAKLSGYVIVQAYLEAATKGDKRILLLEGEILGAVLRYHGDDDHRNNFAAGGHAVAAEITEQDREIVAILKPHLNDRGIFFAGIDVIGGKLIEVNVTSPTCLREMQKFTKENLAGRIIERLEKKVA